MPHILWLVLHGAFRNNTIHLRPPFRQLPFPLHQDQFQTALLLQRGHLPYCGITLKQAMGRYHHQVQCKFKIVQVDATSLNIYHSSFFVICLATSAAVDTPAFDEESALRAQVPSSPHQQIEAKEEIDRVRLEIAAFKEVSVSFHADREERRGEEPSIV